MADKKTSLEVIKREIEGEPQSSEEPYKTYIVKEEDLEDDWTENDAKQVSEEPQSPDAAEKSSVEEDSWTEDDRSTPKSGKSTEKRDSSLLQEDGLEASWTEDIEAKEVSQQGQQGEEIQRRFYTDSMQEADSEDGWTEDDDAQETEAKQSKEADHQTFTYFIKEEPVDSDSADDDDDDGITLQATSQSCSKQGGYSSLDNTDQHRRSTQQMSGDRSHDGERRLGGSPSQTELETQIDPSKKGGKFISGNSSLQSSYQSIKNTQKMSGDRSCDGARHLPEDFPLQAYIGTQSDSSERESCTSGNSSMQDVNRSMRNTLEMSGDRSPDDKRHREVIPSRAELGTQTDSSEKGIYMSEYGSNPIPNQVPNVQEKCSVTKDMTEPASSHHEDEGMARDGKLCLDTGSEREHEHKCVATSRDTVLSSQHDTTQNTQCKPQGCLTVKGPVLCSVCKTVISFTLSEALETLTGGKLYWCALCRCAFSCQNYLRDHMKIHAEEKPLKCFKCYHGTKRKGSILSRHMEIGCGQKPYRCTVCNWSFSRKRQFFVHMRIHGEVMPYKCSFCDKGYCYEKSLTAHMRTHPDEKLKECTICNKRFPKMKKHMKIHTKEKSFHCSICNKGFSNHSTLKQHRKIHREEKPFNCSV